MKGSKEWIKTRIELHPGFWKLSEVLKLRTSGPGSVKWLFDVMRVLDEEKSIHLINTVEWMNDQSKPIFIQVVKERFKEDEV